LIREAAPWPCGRLAIAKKRLPEWGWFWVDLGSFCAQKSQKIAKNRQKSQKIEVDFEVVLLILKRLSVILRLKYVHFLFN